MYTCLSSAQTCFHSQLLGAGLCKGSMCCQEHAVCPFCLHWILHGLIWQHEPGGRIEILGDGRTWSLSFSHDGSSGLGFSFGFCGPAPASFYGRAHYLCHAALVQDCLYLTFCPMIFAKLQERLPSTAVHHDAGSDRTS